MSTLMFTTCSCKEGSYTDRHKSMSENTKGHLLCLLLTLLEHPVDTGCQKRRQGREILKCFKYTFQIPNIFTLSLNIFRFGRSGNCRYAANSHLTFVKWNLYSNQAQLLVESSGNKNSILNFRSLSYKLPSKQCFTSTELREEQRGFQPQKGPLFDSFA